MRVRELWSTAPSRWRMKSLPGDVIEIPAERHAILHPSGDEVFSGAAVQRRIPETGSELRYGTSKITTKTRLPVGISVHHYTVTPIAAIGYQIPSVWSNEGGRVWVYEGEVRIDGCGKKLTVPKDKIAELGRDCKLGAYLRPPGVQDRSTLLALAARRGTDHLLLLVLE